jgi:hypothetical protein
VNGTAILALKLVLTPLLVGLASLAGRRWGPEIGGWLLGAPFTSVPVAFFLALSPGQRFAATAALGIMAGGLFAFAAFFLTLGQLLAATSIAIAFAAAIVVVLVVQGGSLAFGQRLWR